MNAAIEEIVIEATSGGRERRIVIRPPQIVSVGRGSDADLSIPEDNHLGRLHFAVVCEESRCLVRDLQSRNGTFVGGERVSELVVTGAVRITAGETHFSVRVISAPVRQRKRADRPYGEALRDSDPAVRRAALLAAASTGQTWLLDHCRAKAREPTTQCIDELLLLAVLESGPETRRLLEVGGDPSLGPRRFEVLGALGHPDGVPALLSGIASGDVDTSVAAGRAFTKITGANIDSDRRATISAGDGDPASEFDREFLPEVTLPSLELAERHWKTVERELARTPRWSCGIDLGRGDGPEALAQLDMESRSEAELRSLYYRR